MTHEHEPFGAGEPAQSSELRDLYRRLQPPPLAEEAEDGDPETARVVAWMRGAWAELVPPPIVQPRPALQPGSRRWNTRSWRIGLSLAAAALVLALAGAGLWQQLAGIERIEPPPRVAQGLDFPEESGQPAPGDEPAPAADPKAIQVLVSNPGQLELRSGPVRLVLLTPPTRTSGILPGS